MVGGRKGGNEGKKEEKEEGRREWITGKKSVQGECK